LIKIRYVGSKNKISKEIAPIIQKYIDDNNIKTYFEPFVGGANMIDKIKCDRRIGNDINEYLIALLNKMSEGWQPPVVFTEKQYKDIKKNKSNYPNYLVGYVGFQLSFGGKFFGGYRRDHIGKRNYIMEAYKNTIEQESKIKDVKFICDDYLTLNETKMKNWVIYCDPPYQNTTKYSTGGFEYDVFWQLVRDTSKNNFVFVSEYNAPKDFKCIWSKECKTLLDSNKDTDDKNNIRIEKLFTYAIK
jgi:DNA adenine methylase